MLDHIRIKRQFNFATPLLAGFAGLFVPGSCWAQTYPTPGSAAAGSLPSIATGGVVSASAFGKLSAVAPGSLMEIYGSNLAAATLDWGSAFDGTHAPTSLDGTSVTIGGEDAFVAYVSPGQVNVQVPSGVGIGPQPVIVKTGSGTSSPSMITVKATEPGLLAPASFNLGGKQYVAAFFVDHVTLALPPGAITGVPSRRAKPGNPLTLYGIGFGDVIPNMPAGQIAQGSTMLAASFQVKFGTTPAMVTYAGLAPGETGVYQFDVTVPSVASNDAVPLAFTLGGVAGTQTLYIAVQNGNPAVEVKSVTLSTNSVSGGGTVQGTVALSAPALAGGAVVALSSNSSAASVPATVTVPADATSATFTVTTSAVSSNQAATIAASYGGGSALASLMVTSGATLPMFSVITADATFSANGMTFVGTLQITDIPEVGLYVGGFSVVLTPAGNFIVGASFNTVSVAGDTFTLTGVIVGPDSLMTNGSQNYGITSGSVVITLAPNGAPGVGNVTGTFTVTSALETLTGTISGSYTAQ